MFHPEHPLVTGKAWRLLVLGSVLISAVACQQQGLVGVQNNADSAAADAGFLAEFASPADGWQEQTAVSGARVTFGLAEAQARDGYLAELVFPGQPGLASDASSGPDLATEIRSNRRFGFGTYRARLAFGECAENEETVSAFLGYFNDGRDYDQDGITDDEEISIQVGCSAPNLLYLTVFTDYQESGSRVVFRKLTRVIDLASGDAYETPAPDSDAFSSVPNATGLRLPASFTPNTFYELGFEWHTDFLRFFLIDTTGSEQTLWRIDGAESIPQLPVALTCNLWHPESHWYPLTGPADLPAADVVFRVDWIEFTPAP
jgi:hypothetical protein